MIAQLLLCLALVAPAVLGSPVDYIINGNTVSDASKYPWQCSLRYSTSTGSHTCGAAIISSTWILTAAHCVGNLRQVMCGSLDRYGGTARTIRQIIKHPNYGSGAGSYPNDIAVIKTDAFPIGGNIRSVTMDAQGADHSGQSCDISGWGHTQTGYKTLPRYLQEARIKVFSNTECKRTWGNGINPGHVCVGGVNKGVCQGDSGGPLTCGSTLVGVTSWAVRGCYPNYPSVYTRVAYFRNWVKQNTGV